MAEESYLKHLLSEIVALTLGRKELHVFQWNRYTQNDWRIEDEPVCDSGILNYKTDPTSGQ